MGQSSYITNCICIINCLSNAIDCTWQTIKSLAVCVCPCARVLGGISRKRLEREVRGSNGTPIGNDIWRIDWSRDWWRHVTQKGQSRDTNMLGPLSQIWLEIHVELWLHVTLKVKVIQIYLMSVTDGIWQTPCSFEHYLVGTVLTRKPVYYWPPTLR